MAHEGIAMSAPEPEPALEVEEIFHTAAELPAAARSAYLLGACAGQPAVLARIERLLASHDDGAFMQRAADGIPAAEIRRPAVLKSKQGEAFAEPTQNLPCPVVL